MGDGKDPRSRMVFRTDFSSEMGLYSLDEVGTRRTKRSLHPTAG